MGGQLPGRGKKQSLKSSRHAKKMCKKKRNRDLYRVSNLVETKHAHPTFQLHGNVLPDNFGPTGPPVHIPPTPDNFANEKYTEQNRGQLRPDSLTTSGVATFQGGISMSIPPTR